MPSFTKTTSLPSGITALQAISNATAHFKKQGADYYAYERSGDWHFGLGSHAGFTIDSTGSTSTVTTAAGKESFPIAKGTKLSAVSRAFMAKYSQGGTGKVFGNVAFNYAAHVRGQNYTPGHWPLVSILVPITSGVIHTAENGGITAEITSLDQAQGNSVASFFSTIAATIPPRPNLPPLPRTDSHYTQSVTNAINEISARQYDKVILSRAVDLNAKIDMPSTLYWGRLGNAPKRCYSFSHNQFEATGFSPELVLAVQGDYVVTEPLAGTRSAEGTEEEIAARKDDLLHDVKEIVEHVLSVKEAIGELDRLCDKSTVKVKELMDVRRRGPCQHLASTVEGTLNNGNDSWDALDVLFPAITASGIGSKDTALDAIERLEPRVRELYSGGVMMLEVGGEQFFDMALVLRSVLQMKEQGKSWAQAGAGVIKQSRPQRELTETNEKLASVGPFLVAEA